MGERLGKRPLGATSVASVCVSQRGRCRLTIHTRTFDARGIRRQQISPAAAALTELIEENTRSGMNEREQRHLLALQKRQV
jgi:hypothetical protein